MSHVRDTSIDVYHQIEQEGLLSQARWEVYRAVYNHGPITAQEVFKKQGLETNQSGRFTELRDMGVLKEVGERECTVTGRNVILWDVTDKLPTKLERGVKPRLTDKQKRDALRDLRLMVARTNEPCPQSIIDLGLWLKAHCEE